MLLLVLAGKGDDSPMSSAVCHHNEIIVRERAIGLALHHHHCPLHHSVEKSFSAHGNNVDDEPGCRIFRSIESSKGLACTVLARACGTIIPAVAQYVGFFFYYEAKQERFMSSIIVAG